MPRGPTVAKIVPSKIPNPRLFQCLTPSEGIDLFDPASLVSEKTTQDVVRLILSGG